jgi:hypothetical protein
LDDRPNFWSIQKRGLHAELRQQIHNPLTQIDFHLSKHISPKPLGHFFGRSSKFLVGGVPGLGG